MKVHYDLSFCSQQVDGDLGIYQKHNIIAIMFNIGVGFMVLGLMMWLYGKLPTLGARRRLTATARIVGYKQFPTDATITDNNVFVGQNFSWHRVVVFKNSQTGQAIEMFSNPGVAIPEPIGTMLEISFDPKKTDQVLDFVWVQGGLHAVETIARISFMTGLIAFVVLLFVPKSSFLHFVVLVPAFLVVFVVAYVNIWKRPNQ
jgi:hypothetical protein